MKRKNIMLRIHDVSETKFLCTKDRADSRRIRLLHGFKGRAEAKTACFRTRFIKNQRSHQTCKNKMYEIFHDKRTHKEKEKKRERERETRNRESFGFLIKRLSTNFAKSGKRH